MSKELGKIDDIGAGQKPVVKNPAFLRSLDFNPQDQVLQPQVSKEARQIQLGIVANPEANAVCITTARLSISQLKLCTNLDPT